ncbi:MAG: MOSC domain-containing protein [Clostridiales Family XIII bacterium]|jgi:MOSC domain-containing protein YiiM|nr:MOSC domain-containing protein [Clostridiales Family XIII bacterium]
MAKVVAVCISEKKGERKHPVDEIRVNAAEGVVGDAHGEDPVRQISLLADESVDKLRDRMPQLAPGDFAENILIEGLIPYELPVGTKLQVGETELEMTQIGKECHFGCEIRQLTGDCVMPREGVFARVIVPGAIRAGDEVRVVA